LKKEPVQDQRLDIPAGTVKELTSMKELGAFLSQDEEICRWWRVNMGYVKDDDEP
jgi:hypothetical protein